MVSSADERKEIEGIKYLKEHNDMTNVEVVLKVYNRIVEQNIFKTTPGLEYLKELQTMLLENGIDRKSIRAIPIIDEADVQSEKLEKKVPKIDVVNRKSGEENNNLKEVERNLKDNNKVRRVEYKDTVTKEDSKYKEYFCVSVILNAVLMVVIIIMLIIANSKNNPTVLNYEKKIVDKYASWADELKDKEAELNSRENALELME